MGGWGGAAHMRMARRGSGRVAGVGGWGGGLPTWAPGDARCPHCAHGPLLPASGCSPAPAAAAHQVKHLEDDEHDRVLGPLGGGGGGGDECA